MKITGVMVQYYKSCITELWYFTHGVIPIQEDENLRIGKFIEEQYKTREKIRNVVIDDSISIDLLNSFGEVVEIKKSRIMNEPKLYQLYYYLLRLKRKGLLLEGRLVIPQERKTMKILLTPEIEAELINIEKEIANIAKEKKPPEPIRKPYCKKCAYYELCWVD